MAVLAVWTGTSWVFCSARLVTFSTGNCFINHPGSLSLFECLKVKHTITIGNGVWAEYGISNTWELPELDRETTRRYWKRSFSETLLGLHPYDSRCPDSSPTWSLSNRSSLMRNVHVIRPVPTCGLSSSQGLKLELVTNGHEMFSEKAEERNRFC